ncbi:anthrone oxygenase family protein [Kitasatospora sp. NPDC052896]|uniref:anthrone oxygenase family protein n=1 Tax=Kitasatospora sp. NPDC052896 TaxID=3364061 RepID=UPI0037CABA0B
MQETLAVVTIVVVGVMVGVEFAVAAFVNPILDRLPNDGGLGARSDGARVLGRIMPFWYLGSVALGTVWAALAWGGASASLVATGTALLVLGVVMSILLLVPINSRVATWSNEGAPADWKRQLERWDRLHHVRVGVIVLAFALFAVALV